VQKLDGNGNFVWARRLGSTGDDWSHDIAVAGDVVYVAARSGGATDVDPSAGIANTAALGGGYSHLPVDAEWL
jgi:hypothetical protein